MNIRNKFPKRSTQKLFLIGLMAVIAFNLVALRFEFDRINAFKKVLPNQIIGYQFNGLKEILGNVERIGYYTDQDTSTKDGLKLFAHAQYMLAPIIVEQNNFENRYILFVCAKEENAWKKIKEIEAEPLNRNQYGMILTLRKQ